MAENFIIDIAVKIIGKLALASIQDIGSICGVRSDLKRIEFTVSAIKAVLLDAAVRQVSSQQVRDWLEKLQDVLYDIDDLLDDLMTEDLRRQAEVGDSKRKKVLCFFSPSNQLVFSAKMTGKVKKLRERLEDIAVDRRNYPFVEQQLVTQSHKSREQSHSFIRTSDVIGRDHDKDEILKLLSSPSHDNNLHVLPIIGFGGLGKTTLAKLVFNNKDIKFDTRIWVCASESFDLEDIIGRIIAATGADSSGQWDLDQKLNWLQDHLKHKKFLIVLDDVWNEDPKKWVDLRNLLFCGAEGSTVIVTTRSNKTANVMGTFPAYSLKGLSDHECLSIFLKCAFKDGQGKAYPNLVEIGKAIVKKCGGVPLAVRSLGSLLYTTTAESEWTYIKDSEVWEIAQKENDILPILRLSYDQMPVHLRRCFAYCAIYPKDFSITRDDLICRWISQDYIQSDGYRQLEEIGRQYVNDLISWSCFQDVNEGFDDEVQTFQMHDLVHDLAQSVAGKEISIANFGTKNAIDAKVRHISFFKGNLPDNEFPSYLLKLKKVRSFVLAYNVQTISIASLEELIKTFKCLRVMDLSGSQFEELPCSIRRLKHLRYLSLDNNHTLRSLPDSICDLLNLQTLNLRGCRNLQNLPRNLCKLQSLRNLFLSSDEIVCYPEKGIGDLRSLRFLSIWRWYFMQSLPEGMQHLVALTELVISFCPYLRSLPGSLKYLISLKVLRIKCCRSLNLMEGDGMQGLISLNTLEIVELIRLKELPQGLQNSAATLKYLSIEGCPYLEALPSWLTDCTSLLKISVTEALDLEFLPRGMQMLTSLRYLCLTGNARLIRQCEDENGEYWPWICSIPEYVLSTGVSVFNSPDDVVPWEEN